MLDGLPEVEESKSSILRTADPSETQADSMDPREESKEDGLVKIIEEEEELKLP